MKLTKTNPKVIELIRSLKEKSYEENVKIWKDFAKRLERPSRNYAEVNISKINRYSSPDETILVPGKILGSGQLDHMVNVAALGFSKKAEEKIGAAGGRCLNITEILNENPKGSKIRIIK
ncbi:MAG: 50S ribosomal protein L18e [Methanobacteriaceae archaeon]|jgi:large subunit ribosomal protein L18e